MSSKIFIIILNYKKHKDTQNCINSLRHSDLPANTHFVIVDNSPTTTSINYLKKKFPKVKIIKSPRNLGFAAGNNLGIKYALTQKATHILIINPDVQVPRRFLKPLLKVFNTHSQAGLVAPAHKHVQKNKTFYGLGGEVNWTTSLAKHINEPQLKSLKPQKYQFVSFACVLIKSSVFKKIGFLDQRYFMYLEDVDFCLTALKNKFTIYLNPSVQIIHHTSSSFKRPTDKLKISFISQLKFIHKWFTFPRNLVSYLYVSLFYPYLYLLWTYHSLKYKHA